MNNIRDQIHQLPKADVHNHLHLGGNIKALKEAYPYSKITIPHFYDGLDGMIDFIHSNINTIMQTSKDVVNLMDSAIRSSIDDNVTYLEASVDLNLTKYFDHSIEKLIEVVSVLKSKYQSQIDFRPDIGVNKDSPLDKVYSDGIICINSGVFNGIDLYGKEFKKPLGEFKEIFASARQKDLKTKVHIGEFSNCQTIEDTITLLNPDEIQHGINAVQSEKTMNMILNNNIQLNICPQSNFSLGAIKNIKEHPIRKLYDYGIKITINTDDFLLFNSTITNQCMSLLDNNIFSLEEIKIILNNGFR